MAEPRRPGRPIVPDDDRMVPITVRVPAKDFDRACQRERSGGTKVRELMRQGLRRVLDDDDLDSE